MLLNKFSVFSWPLILLTNEYLMAIVMDCVNNGGFCHCLMTLVKGNINFKNGNILQNSNSTHTSGLGRQNFSFASSTISPKLICFYVITKKFSPLVMKNLCTHINVGFFGLDEKTYLLENSTKKIQILQEVLSLKKKNKYLKILISVGGANCQGFSSVVKIHKTRKIFVRSVIDFLKKYDVDGVDLDWEWPVINGNAKEKVNFVLLLHEFRKEFDRHKKKYIISIDVSPSKAIIDLSYYIPYIADFVDFVNVMCYDYHFYSQWYSLTGHNAPLYSSVNSIVPLLQSFNVNYSIFYWLSHSMPREKIVLGIPTFGHTYRLISPSKVNLNAPTKGFGSVGLNGFASYQEICNFIKQENTTVFFDKKSMVPYAYNFPEWISFDNEYSLGEKAYYILEQKLSGAMIFSINDDDYLGECSQQILPLIKKVKSILFGKDIV